MSSKWRLMGLITIVLAGVLLLSGCVTIRSQTKINADGSGVRSIMIAMDKSVMAMAQQSGDKTQPPKDPFADVKTSAGKIPGSTVEPYVDPATGSEGVKVTMPFKTLDELVSQQLGEKDSSGKDSSMDKVTWSNDGNVYTVNMLVNTSNVSAGASGGSAETKATPQTEQEKAAAAQMMAAMGIEMSYSIAALGKIVDWAPKEGVTYDAANNEIFWKLDLTNAASMPNLMIKWDNSQKPAPIQAPAAVAAGAAGGGGAAATASMAAQAQTYAKALSGQDEAAYRSLMVGDQLILPPLLTDYPKLNTPDFKLIFGNTFADAKTGSAEWSGQWTDAGKAYKLSGVDILTFDANGKITAIKTYVDPTEFAAALPVLK